MICKVEWKGWVLSNYNAENSTVTMLRILKWQCLEFYVTMLRILKWQCWEYYNENAENPKVTMLRVMQWQCQEY